MKEKEMTADILNTEKNITVNMATALNEASCDSLYQKLLNIFLKISKETKNIFTIAYNKNWYELEEAPKTKITKEYNKLNKELDK